MNKKLTKSSLTKIDELDIRSQVSIDIINLLLDVQFDENQKKGIVTDHEVKTFLENSLQILSLAITKLLIRLPYSREVKIQIGKEVSENILENLLYKLKEDNAEHPN